MPLLPARRVIAIDPGSRVLKVVLAEVFFGRCRILRRETLEIPQGLGDKDDETAKRLQALLKEIGPYPVALAFPQHLTLSQVIELPVVAEAEVHQLIENETVKLGGLSETRIIYDYARLAPFGRHQHSFWITLCQENEFTAGLKRLALETDNVCDATSVGNALRAAYLGRIPATTPTVLADIGVRSTTLVILYRGQAVHISSFALGAELFFESIARERNFSLAQALEWAEEKKMFEGPEAVAALRLAVNNWYDELIRVVQEWRLDHNELNLNLETFQFVLSGGGAVPTGLTSHLNRRFGAKRFVLWPEEEGGSAPGIPPGHFAVASGTAWQALEKNPQTASLLPAHLRAQWTEQKFAQRLQSVCFFLLILLAMILGLGTWQKISLANRKHQLLAEADLALRQAADTEKISRGLVRDYEQIRPALERQRRTLDILQTLATLQQVRSNRTLWFGLFADSQSYFSAPTGGSTNDTAMTLPAATAPSPTVLSDTNRPAIQPDLIAEVGIPEGGEAMRRTLSQLVAGLKRSPRFRNVDILSTEQRRPLEDARLIIPDHYFTIAFELAENEFKPAEPKPAQSSKISSPVSATTRTEARSEPTKKP